MGNYVDRTLASDERILANARFHWSYTALSIFYLLAFGIILIGIYLFLKRIIEEMTTEIAVTNKRFVYKKGFIRRQTTEFTTDRIEGVNFSHGIIGRLFGFGILHIRGSGIGEVDLPPIAAPLEFRRALIEAHRSAPSKDQHYSDGGSGPGFEQDLDPGKPPLLRKIMRRKQKAEYRKAEA